MEEVGSLMKIKFVDLNSLYLFPFHHSPILFSLMAGEVNYKKCDKGYLIKCLGVGDFGNLYKITGTDSLQFSSH